MAKKKPTTRSYDNPDIAFVDKENPGYSWKIFVLGGGGEHFDAPQHELRPPLPRSGRLTSITSTTRTSGSGFPGC